MAESHIEKKEKKCVAKGQEKEKKNNKAEGLNIKKWKAQSAYDAKGIRLKKKREM